MNPFMLNKMLQVLVLLSGFSGQDTDPPYSPNRVSWFPLVKYFAKSVMSYETFALCMHIHANICVYVSV